MNLHLQMGVRLWITELERMQGKGNSFSLLVRLQAGLATLEISVENSQKVKNKSAIRPSYTIPGHLSKGSTSYSTDTCSAMFTTALLTAAMK